MNRRTIVISLKRPYSRMTAALLLGSMLLITPSAASASPETLQRSVSNMVQAPLDMLLSPITAALGITQKLQDIDDTMPVRIVYTLPGYLWYTGVCIFGGALRGVTGAIELIPGIVLLPAANTDLDPMFAPVERAPALVERDEPIVIFIKFGIDYTTAGF
jgi:hypothetical protein